jgi:hypothetical protein
LVISIGGTLALGEAIKRPEPYPGRLYRSFACERHSPNAGYKSTASPSAFQKNGRLRDANGGGKSPAGAMLLSGTRGRIAIDSSLSFMALAIAEVVSVLRPFCWRVALFPLALRWYIGCLISVRHIAVWNEFNTPDTSYTVITRLDSIDRDGVARFYGLRRLTGGISRSLKWRMSYKPYEAVDGVVYHL